MRVELDPRRPKDDSLREPLFFIRLFPETNAEMGIMEWGLDVMSLKATISRVPNNFDENPERSSFQYVISLENKKK